MLNNLNRVLEETITGWWVLGTFTLYLVFGMGVMPWGASMIYQAAGQEVKILDLEFFYTGKQAFEILATYTPDALQMAALFNATGDVAYPLIYGCFLCSLLVWLLKLSHSGKSWQKYYSLPLLVSLVDYLENTFIITSLLNYPSIPIWILDIAGTFTLLKWVVMLMCTLFILIAAFKLLAYKVQRR